ncbi:MAG: methyltransferase [Pseudomonadota bacterium]
MSAWSKSLVCVGLLMGLAACQQSADEVETADMEAPVEDVVEEVVETEQVTIVDPAPEMSATSDRLASVLAMQSEDAQARYGARHPKETLEFFGIEPGMTVVEALPGGGWYSKILIPYLGAEGTLVGANYPISLFEQFGFATPEFMESIANWPVTFPLEAAAWCADDCAAVEGFWLGDLPESHIGTADAVVFIRALHNMARFQNAGVDQFLDQALADVFAVLKPGGVFGVVQHEISEEIPDEAVTGEAGYLKRSFVIAQAEAAGFVLEEASDINANPMDQAGVGDIVWRLPPTLGTSQEDPELRAELEAIGETNRMTLRFRKPAE